MVRDVFNGFLVRVYSDGPLAFALLSPVDDSPEVRVRLYSGFSKLEDIRKMTGRPVTIVNETNGLVRRVFSQNVSTSNSSVSYVMLGSEVDRKNRLYEEYLHPERFFDAVA